jgi:hypothetical protein
MMWLNISLAPRFSGVVVDFISTPLQRGVKVARGQSSRFNGLFPSAIVPIQREVESVETVSSRLGCCGFSGVVDFISTPLQRGVKVARGQSSRFNGLSHSAIVPSQRDEETVETVSDRSARQFTALKRGANDNFQEEHRRCGAKGKLPGLSTRSRNHLVVATAFHP